MKQQLTKFAAVLCTGAMLAGMPVTASANASETVLPSGITVGEFEQKLTDFAAESDKYMNAPEYISAAVGVFQGEDVLYTGYFGEVNRAEHIKADENAVYEWGSISKTLIWVSVMQLWEQGKIDLERDIRDYLPEGFFQHLSYDEPITMLNLMNHNAGWQETTRTIWEEDESRIPALGDALRAIEPAQVHRPGEVVAYSNYGAAVAGYAVECITGTDYCEYVNEHIFKPLGMTHTALDPARRDNAWVREQRGKSRSYSIVSMPMNTYTIDNGTREAFIPAYPAGAAAGTIGDLMTYAQALVSDEAPLFEKPETQALLFSGTDFYGDSEIPMCCHGFWCTEGAVRYYGHSGATVFGQADMEIDPVSKTGVVVMVNEQAGNWFNQSAASLVFGSMSPGACGEPVSDQAPDLSGKFIPARGTPYGMMRFTELFSSFSLDDEEDIAFDDLGNGVVQMRSETDGAFVLGVRQDADGLTIETPSVDLLPSKGILPQLLLFAFYMLAAVAAYYMLRIRIKLTQKHKWQGYGGSKVIGAGFAAQLVSVLSLLVMFTVYYAYYGGLPDAAAAGIGIVQMICLAVCVTAAVRAVIGMFTAKGSRAPALWYGVCAAGNLLTAAAILVFSLYRFWGC